jgi:hypothetical protein
MNTRAPLTHARRRISPASVLAALALFFALGGSALAVGERVRSDAAQAQRACSQGNVRGVAHVTGAAGIPGAFSGAGGLFGRRYNCTGRAIQVRRIGIGSYQVRFVGNGAPNALASGGINVQASAERIGPGVFHVGVYPSGRADPADFPFLVVLV